MIFFIVRLHFDFFRRLGISKCGLDMNHLMKFKVFVSLDAIKLVLFLLLALAIHTIFVLVVLSVLEINVILTVSRQDL